MLDHFARRCHHKCHLRDTGLIKFSMATNHHFKCYNQVSNVLMFFCQFLLSQGTRHLGTRDMSITIGFVMTSKFASHKKVTSKIAASYLRGGLPV